MRSYAVDHHVSPSSGQLDPKSGNSNGEDQKPQNKKTKNKKKKKKKNLNFSVTQGLNQHNYRLFSIFNTGVNGVARE